MLKKERALFSPAWRDGHGETRERARAAASSQYICRESHRSATVKARVIALYALVLSNANHRRQNVRRAVAPRRIALVAGRRRSSLLSSRSRWRVIPRVTSSTHVCLPSKARFCVLPPYRIIAFWSRCDVKFGNLGISRYVWQKIGNSNLWDIQGMTFL